MTKPIMKVICMNKEYITLMELAQSLKISRATIDRWRKEGMLHIKLEMAFVSLSRKCLNG